MKIPHRIASCFTILLLAGLFLTPQRAAAQRASSHNNDIAIDFVDYLVNNVFTGQYEFKSTSTSSFVLRAEYETKNTGAGTGVTSAFGIGAGWRFYILDSRALSGFSITPAVDLYFFKNSTLSRNNIVFTIGADAAYKFFFDQFTVEPTLGVRNGFVPSNDPPPGENTFSGIYPVVNIYLGWAW